MNRRRWERVKQLFDRARRIPESGREAFLERECQEDASMIAEVLRLLEGDRAEGFLEPPEDEDLALPLETAAATLDGARFDDFELLEEIGRGAMGVVYLARQVSLNRRVAVKVLAPHLCGSPDREERFRREALSASRLRHPNIVTILAFGEHRGLRYIAMEYVAGKSLRDVLAEKERGGTGEPADPRAGKRQLDPKEAAKILLGVARALEHCHGLGIIHRDIKPHNILIDPRGEPRLVDFGLAKDVDLDSLSAEGSLFGTPHYMSPEQARARGSEIDHRTDIYSAGAVLYELLTSRKPFEGENSPAVLYNITHEKPRSIAALAPGVPSSLAAICTKAMGKVPESRYPSARELAQDLERFLGGQRVRAPKPNLLRRAYEFGFYEHRRAAGIGAVVLFASFVALYPRSPTVLASSRGAMSSWPGTTKQRPDLLPPSRDEVVMKPWREEMQAIKKMVLEKLPQEPVYH